MSGNNLLENVSYRFNSIIFKFNESMYRYKDIYSYLNPQNYAVLESDFLIPFPSETGISEISNTDSVRFTLPPYLKGILHDGVQLRTGYVDFQHIQYIKSTTGKIQDLCQSIFLSIAVPQLSISEGRLDVLDKSSLKYFYEGENQFSYVDPQDFYVPANNGKVYAVSAKLENSKTVLFTFPENTLEYTGVDLYTEIYPDKRTYSRDLYGYGITQHSHVSTPGSIQNLSVCLATNGVSTFRIMFNTPIATFNAADFRMICNDQVTTLLSASIDSTGYVVTIRSRVPFQTYNDPVGIYTAVPIEEVKTMDINGNKIYQPKAHYTELFIATNGEVNFKYNVLKGTTIKLTYSKDINPATLITDIHFDGSNVPWDGNPLTVPPGCLITSQYYDISLKNNPSFGTFSIVTKSNYTFINNTGANTAPCTITLENNDLTLSFDPEDPTLANSPGSDGFLYFGGETVMSMDDYFLCRSPVIVSVRYDNPLIIEPLNSSWQNPFNGGTFNNDFLILVDTEHTYYEYGNINYETIVNGNIHFEGTMKAGTMPAVTNVTANNITYDITYV